MLVCRFDPSCPLSPVVIKLLPFLAWRSRVTKESLHADAVAGLIGALVVLPQGVAYATLAGLPPQFGLYCAIVPVIVAALWGSSWHQISGPTNALSLVVFATVAPLAVPLSAGYISLVLTLTLMVGLLQLAMGLARLGTLVNFISHTVIVGFTAGAGLLIIAAQLRTFFGVRAEGHAAFLRERLRLRHRSADGRPVDHRHRRGHARRGAGRQAKLPRVPFMVVAMVAGSLFALAAVACRCRQHPHRRQTAVRPAAAVAAVVQSGRLAQARAGRARADRCWD